LGMAIARALARAPGDRHADVEAFLRSLKPRSRPLWLIAPALALCLVGPLLVLVWWPQSALPPPSPSGRRVEASVSAPPSRAPVSVAAEPARPVMAVEEPVPAASAPRRVAHR